VGCTGSLTGPSKKKALIPIVSFVVENYNKQREKRDNTYVEEIE